MSAVDVAPKVLIIDDEPDMLNLTSQRLEYAGYRVLAATDGLEGLRLARSYHPDVILLDIMMPVMDGYQVLRLLKSDTATEEIPVVMLTAKGDELDMRISIDLGSAYHLVKPFQSRELLEEVKLAVQRHTVTHYRPAVSNSSLSRG